MIKNIIIFLKKFIGERENWSIHLSIVVVCVVLLIANIFTGKDLKKTVSAMGGPVDGIDVQKADIFVAKLANYVPPLNDVVYEQNIAFLAEGNSFFDKPSITNTVISGLPRDKITTYTVSEGETYWTIAYKFELDIDSLLWANDIKNIDNMEIGKELVILPSTGLLHIAKEGDTIESLATKYKATADIIKQKNPQLASGVVVAGDKVFIPGAKKDIPKPVTPVTTPTGVSAPSQQVPKYGSGSQTYTGPALVGSGSFAWPVNSSGRFISQYFGWVTKYYKHTGVDLDWRNGLDIIAADRGTVVAVSYGWGGGYGNHIIVDHGNGYQTLYAHLSSIKVTPGQSVDRGQSIGVMGTTGISTGVHLHFEVRQGGVAIDPLGFIK